MHKPQGRVVLCTYCTFRVYSFQVLCPFEHIFIIGFYIGLTKFWVSVLGLIYKTLETFSLSPACSMLIHSDR
jgi:hypothetical protein